MIFESHMRISYHVFQSTIVFHKGSVAFLIGEFELSAVVANAVVRTFVEMAWPEDPHFASLMFTRTLPPDINAESMAALWPAEMPYYARRAGNEEEEIHVAASI